GQGNAVVVCRDRAVISQGQRTVADADPVSPAVDQPGGAVADGAAAVQIDAGFVGAGYRAGIRDGAEPTPHAVSPADNRAAEVRDRAGDHGPVPGLDADKVTEDQRSAGIGDVAALGQVDARDTGPTDRAVIGDGCGGVIGDDAAPKAVDQR